MGGLCDSIFRGKLDADQIVANINKLFQGMLIRKLSIDQIKEKISSRVASGQITDLNGLKQFLDEEIINSEYTKTCQELVGEAMQDAQTNYNDQTLPLLSLLFLSDSNKDNFLSAFKAVSLAKKGQSAANNIQNVVSAGKQGGIFAGIASGMNAIKSVASAAHQAANPNLIRRDELKTLMRYYINFLTLLPVNLLAKHGEGIPMKGYFAKVLNEAFNKDVQNRFVEDTLFVNYNNQEEINVEEFFGSHYLTLKNDNDLRKGLVNNYISNLSPAQIVQIVSGN